MGDAVNLAARLEPANKDYGTCIIASEFTFEKAKQHIDARLLDKIVVQGKGKPVCIYEVLGRKGQSSPEMAGLTAVYERALRLYWERKWDDAIASMEEALKINPDDGASLQIISRAKVYRINPPGPGWTGEYERMSKD